MVTTTRDLLKIIKLTGREYSMKMEFCTKAHSSTIFYRISARRSLRNIDFKASTTMELEFQALSHGI